MLHLNVASLCCISMLHGVCTNSRRRLTHIKLAGVLAVSRAMYDVPLVDIVTPSDPNLPHEGPLLTG